jgi:hypothetical protein
MLRDLDLFNLEASKERSNLSNRFNVRNVLSNLKRGKAVCLLYGYGVVFDCYFDAGLKF